MSVFPFYSLYGWQFRQRSAPNAANHPPCIQGDERQVFDERQADSRSGALACYAAGDHYHSMYSFGGSSLTNPLRNSEINIKSFSGYLDMSLSGSNG